jgi:glycosyltransferase involved in cell wall biosynthesis
MKILQIATAYQSVATILSSKLRLLAETPGVELHVASSFEDAQERRKCPGTFFRVEIPRAIRPMADVSAAFRLAGYIRRTKVQVVHTHTAKAGIVGALAGRLAGVPVVHTYHGLPWFSGQSAFTNRMYRGIEFHFSRGRMLVFSQNRRDFEELSKGFPCPVKFEGNGVDADEVARNAAEHVRDVESLYPAGDVRILCVARLEPVKCLETVIQCARFLKEHGRRPSVVIAGKGPLEGRLRSVIREQGLEDRIAIVYTPHIHSLTGLADVAVLSSVKEGIPRGLMEAMALGKPVVATDVLGTNELVVSRETGMLVPLGDQGAFNAAVLELVSSPVSRERYGQAGKKRVSEQFDEREIVQLWLQTYRGILARNRACNQMAGSSHMERAKRPLDPLRKETNY